MTNLELFQQVVHQPFINPAVMREIENRGFMWLFSHPLDTQEFYRKLKEHNIPLLERPS